MRSVSSRVRTLAVPLPQKPRLRGVLHQYAFFVSLFCGVGLILAASAGRARLAATIYAAEGLTMFLCLLYTSPSPRD